MQKPQVWSLDMEEPPWRRKRQSTSVFLPGKSHGRGSWWATVHGVAKSWTWLSDWTTIEHISYTLTHTNAHWHSQCSVRGSHNYCYWRRQWHPIPVLLPGKSHGLRSLVGCRPWGREELDMTEQLQFQFLLSCIGGGNGNPLQCSCLENPRDGGAWWAAISGVTQSWTWLQWLSIIFKDGWMIKWRCQPFLKCRSVSFWYHILFFLPNI